MLKFLNNLYPLYINVLLLRSMKKNHFLQKIYPVLSIIFLFVLGLGRLEAEEPKSENIASGSTGSGEEFNNLKNGVRRYVLENGLRVIVYRRENAPVFTGQVWVGVGGVDERPGNTGSAHFLEHLAFKGTTTVGTKDYEQEKVLLEEYNALFDIKNKQSKNEQTKNEEAKNEEEAAKISARLAEVEKKLRAIWIDNQFSQIYESKGAEDLNAQTAKDYTMYVVSLPKNSFELWTFMEADRIINPVFRQFYDEREVIREERRSNYDDSPQGKMYEQLLFAAYQKHPYRFSNIGFAKDIEQIPLSEVKWLHETFYRPDNMVVTLVGDLDPEEAVKVIEKYFGKLKNPESKKPTIDIVEPVQAKERTTKLSDPNSQPYLVLAYHKPTYPNIDDSYITLLHQLLAGGRTSVLYKELVLEKKLATGISTTEAPGSRYPTLFILEASPAIGVSNEKLKSEIDKILERISNTGFSDEDIEAAKRRSKVEFLSSLNSNPGLASTLGSYELLFGNWSTIFDLHAQLNTTTNQDLKRVLKTYFIKSNRTVGFIERSK